MCKTKNAPRTHHRLIAFVMAVITMLSLLTACGEPATPSTIPNPSVETAAPVETAPVEITAPTEMPEPTATTVPQVTVPQETETTTMETTPEATESATTEPAETDPKEEPISVKFKDVDEIVYANRYVNVRTGPKKAYGRIGGLNFGDKVKRTGIGENGWSRIEYNGKVAYAYSAYLQTSKPKKQETEPTETKPAETEPPKKEDPKPVEVTFEDVNETVWAKESVNVRTGPGTSYDKIGTLSAKDEVIRTGIGSNGWSRIEYNGKIAYANGKYLTTDKPKEVTYKEVNETVYAIDGVNVRSGPGTNFEKVGRLSRKDTVIRIGIGDNGWSKVLYNDKEAYISSNYLSTEKPEDPAKGAKVVGSYSDATCTITVYKEWHKNAWCYAAHLQFTDYGRFGTASAKGKYNSGLETTSKAAKRIGAILCVNGDYAIPSNGAGGYAVARGGVVCNNKTLYSEGIYSFHDGILAYRTHNGCAGNKLSDMVNAGKVTDTFQFAPAVVINGEIQCGSGGGRAQRTFLGTNGKPGDIWVVVSDGRYNDGVSAGLTGYEMATYLVDKGCTFVVPLDGGGSSTMWFNGKVLNAAKNSQRKVADFVYFR